MQRKAETLLTNNDKNSSYLKGYVEKDVLPECHSDPYGRPGLDNVRVFASKSEIAAIRSLQVGVVLGLSSGSFQTLGKGLC